MRLSALRLLASLALALSVAPAWAHGPRGPDPRSDQAEGGLVLAEPTLPPDSTSRLEQASDPLPVERPGIGAVEVISILAVLLGLAGFRRSCRRDRRTLIATTTAALVLGFVLGTAPHLVHHSLDADQGADCEALQTVERSQAAAGAIDATPVQVSADLADASLIATAPTSAAPSPRGRAPPA